MRTTALLSFVAFAIAATVPAAGQAPIIDMHLHAFGFDEYGLPVPPNEVTGRSPTYHSDREAMEASFAAMRAAGFGDRIMFGSDQMVWPESIGLAVAGIDSASFLTAAQKRAIFYDNAARFLRLTDAEIRQDHSRSR
jgi:hypothetical protein